MRRVYSRDREEDYSVVVDWNLGNSCNLQCSYCHPFFKSGRNPFPQLSKAKEIVTKIAAKHRDGNRPVRFSFVGGEPTLYPGLPSLCRHIKESAWYQVSVSTNASASLDYWKALAPWIDIVAISYHEGRADFDHVVAVAGLLRKLYKTVNIAFPMMPDTFDASFARYQELKAAGFNVWLQPLYADHMLRRQLMEYSSDQKAILFPEGSSDIVIVAEDGQLERLPSSEHMIYAKRNSFTGMRCGIGFDQLVIDQDGTIRGGWCRVGGSLGNVHTGELEMPTEAFVCTKSTCNNPGDLAVPKWKDGDEL